MSRVRRQGEKFSIALHEEQMDELYRLIDELLRRVRELEKKVKALEA